MRIFCPAMVASVSFAVMRAPPPVCAGLAARAPARREFTQCRCFLSLVVVRRPGVGCPERPGRRDHVRVLLDDLGDATRADGPATLADGELQALLHGDGLDQLDAHPGA